MKALLHPRSVAIIGASDDATKTTGRPLRFLRRAGYSGRIYPVNPNRESVQGERAWPSVEALPEVPEHAYIVTGTDAAIEAVEACGKRGVSVATVLASGFGEAGEAGREREARLRSIVSATGIRLVGPSSLGVVTVRDGVMLTANAAFAEPDLPHGSTFVASHSGSMIGSIVTRGKARGLGFAGLVSVGNEVDLCLGEICATTLDDPAVEGYLLFLETLRRADALRDFALAAAERGKPVIAYKLGRSAAAAGLALTHTGALAGEDDVAEAFLRDCGIARVHTLEGLIEGLALVARIPLPRETQRRRPRVGVVTTTGGGAAMVIDQLGVKGIDVDPFVDLTLAGTRYAVMKGALDELLATPGLDLVVAVPGSSARYEPELAVRPVIDSGSSGKPLAAFVVPEAPQALAMLTAAGVPGFRTPEACADAIAAAFARRIRGKPERPPVFQPGAETLDELESYELLSRIGIRHAAAEAIDPGSPSPALPYPLAVKVLSRAIAHKSDAGGVVLGVKNRAELIEAVRRIRDEVTRKGLKAERLLVQAMATGVGEALVGYRVDPQVGPLVMVAAGGVLAEIYRDRSLRLAPVDLATAREMVNEVKGFAALAGYRGQARGDLEALAETVSAMSRLAVAAGPAVMEAELNPVVVLEAGRGVLAVDALVRVAGNPVGGPVR